MKAREELEKWKEERQRQTEMRKKINLENEAEFYETKKAKREGPNPWERVVENCEMNSAQYVGGADVTRMRQAMLSRKADLTKTGSKNSSKSLI